ncbi:MAG: hypothetical protein K2N07_04155 [Desulfovibrio sp.]|nr:hypothetical protein [Desulfovibrio sp.]
MKKRACTALVCLLCLFCLSAVSAQAGLLRNIIVGGLAGKAAHSEGKSETEILDAVGSTVSDSWSVTSALIKILRAGIGKNGKGGTVQYAIDRYRVDKLYQQLLKHLQGERRTALMAEQEKWRVSGLDAQAKALQQQGIPAAQAYEAAMRARLKELEDLWNSLDIPEETAPPMFAAPKTGDEVCGDVITNTPLNEDNNLILMFVNGRSAAYYSSDPLCRKAKTYMCAKLGKSENAPPELKEAGVDAEQVFRIAGCQGK